MPHIELANNGHPVSIERNPDGSFTARDLITGFSATYGQDVVGNMEKDFNLEGAPDLMGLGNLIYGGLLDPSQSNPPENEIPSLSDYVKDNPSAAPAVSPDESVGTSPTGTGGSAGIGYVTEPGPGAGPPQETPLLRRDTYSFPDLNPQGLHRRDHGRAHQKSLDPRLHGDERGWGGGFVPLVTLVVRLAAVAGISASEQRRA